jgi:hypothetical protein
LYKGESNNAPKSDPYNVTHVQRYSNASNPVAEHDAILDHGTEEVKKRYSNAQDRGNLVTPGKNTPTYNGAIFDPFDAVSGTAMKI